MRAKKERTDRNNRKAQARGHSNNKARQARRDADQERETTTAHMMTATNESSRPLKHQNKTRTLRCGPRRSVQTGTTKKPKPEATQTSRRDVHAEIRAEKMRPNSGDGKPKPEATQTSRRDEHAEMRNKGERRQRRTL
eukprot:1745636-Pleurochrysis_carterae.AAC.3